MAGCCTNTGGRVDTYYMWKVTDDFGAPTNFTWEEIRTGRGHFGGKMYFHQSYDWLIDISENPSKRKSLKISDEKYKAYVCAMQKMIGSLLKEGNVDPDKNTNGAANQKKIEDVWKREIDSLCKKLEKNEKGTQSCYDELGRTAYNTLRDSCESDESVKRRNGTCKCVKNAAAPPAVTKGCMDSAYKEYNPNATEDTEPTSCKTLKKPDYVYGCMDDGENLPANVSVTNYDPDATYDYDCKYSTPLLVENNYMFCTDDTDGSFNGCDPEEAKTIQDGFITPKTYKVVTSTPKMVNNMRADILNIVTTSIASHNDISYIPLRNENKFTKAFNQSIIGDITNALTVSVIETQYKRSEDDPEFQVYPFTYVTVYSPRGANDPISEFKIKRDTAIDAPVGITGIVPVDSTNTFKKRLNSFPGLPTIPPKYANAINKILANNLQLPDIKFNEEGILQENRIPNVGLGKVIYKEPIGLEKLIK